MFATTLLVAFAASASPSAAVSWQGDYDKAFTRAVETQRPLAIFIGHGKADAMLGGISDSTAKRLEKDFVSLYLDVSTSEGRAMAAAFEMTQGLVISGRGGAKQALRLEGEVCAEDIAESLETYARPGLTVTTTATSIRPAPIVQFLQPTCANGNCPLAR